MVSKKDKKITKTSLDLQKAQKLYKTSYSHSDNNTNPTGLKEKEGFNHLTFNPPAPTKRS